MTRGSHILLSLSAIIALPVAGYLVTYALVVVMPTATQSDAYNAVLTLVITLMLLAVPYWMLKLMAHAAHTRNPHERELHLRDIPKDKDQLDRSAR